MRIDKGGDVKVVTGNLIIGTDGKGIDFTANTLDEGGAGSVASELLDDYEEGTFTPTLIAATGTWDNGNNAIDVGFYTKIGNFVHCEGRIKGGGDNGSSGAIKLGGFPFKFSAGGNHYSSGFAGFAGGLGLATADQSVTFYGELDSAQASLQAWVSTGGTSAMSVATFSADGDLMFAIDYSDAQAI